jgi:hypothetical protein
MLTPKAIIMDALRSKFADTGIIKLVLVFNVQVDTYNVMVCQSNDKPLKLDLEQKDISMLKKVLVNKLERLVREEYHDFKSLVIEVEIIKNEFNIFVIDMKDEAHLFKFEN